MASPGHLASEALGSSAKSGALGSVARSSGLKTLEVGLRFGARRGPGLDTFVNGGSVTEDSEMHDQLVGALLLQSDHRFHHQYFCHKISGWVNPIYRVWSMDGMVLALSHLWRWFCHQVRMWSTIWEISPNFTIPVDCRAEWTLSVPTMPSH